MPRRSPWLKRSLRPPALATPVGQVKHRPLWEISIPTTPEAEEAVAEFLATFFQQQVSSYTNFKTGAVVVSVHSPQPPGRCRRRLREGLARITACGLDVGEGRIRLKPLRGRDWVQSWKRHFKPITIGRSLLVKPSWSNRRARKGQITLILDPGLSFGTGHHPTTAFCLGQLVRRRIPRARQSFLDIGCGSGILAIAAAKLGYAPVEAFDLDSEAVRVARSNARRNRVPKKIRLRRADLTRLPGQCVRKFDVICANLIADLAVGERERMISRLKPEGRLILAGILEREFPQVRRAFEASGMKLVAGRTEREWRSGAFEFRAR